MWIDINVDELKAVIEAAEAGQKAGRLKRSAAKLERGLTELRENAQFHTKLANDASA